MTPEEVNAFDHLIAEVQRLQAERDALRAALLTLAPVVAIAARDPMNSPHMREVALLGERQMLAALGPEPAKPRGER